MSRHSVSVSLTIVVGLVALVVSSQVRAQDDSSSGSLHPAETKLAFHGTRKTTIARTLRVVVKGGEVERVGAAAIRDFVDSEDQEIIPAGSLSVTAASVPDTVPPAWVLSLNLAATDAVGRFEGQLEVSARGKDGKPLTPVTVDLELVLADAPTIEVDAQSKTLTVDCALSWCDLPGVGRPAAQPGGSPLATTTAEIASRSLSPINLARARILSLRNENDRTLPDGAVAVVPGKMPMEVGPGETVGLPIEVRGVNLVPGTYKGNLQVGLKENRQPAPSKSPLS